MTKQSFNIDKKASAYIDPKLCINCGKCRRSCPTDSIKEMQRLICRLCPDCVDACSNIKFHLESHDYAEKIACSIGCPLGIVPEGYVNLISEGDVQGAYELINELNPLASICGSICSHPCEESCKRGTLIDKPIAIRALKRYVMENAEKKPVVFKQKYDKKVAIVGAGPSGITAAYDLAKKGYKVTIFEGSASLGGAMKWGIPDFRIDKDMLEKELESIIAAGIHVEFNAMVGVKPTIDDLIADKYSAVLLAVGSTKGFKLPIKNNTAEMVYDAATFMKKVNALTPVKIGKEAVVIGGGSVALDVARSLIRLGVEKATCVCLEDKDTIPAPASEVAEALEEGVEIITGASPQKINATWIHVSGVTFKKVSKMGLDESGKFMVQTIEGSDFEVPCDTVIFATGQKVDVSTMVRKSNLELLPNGKIAVDGKMKTNIAKVFACGDAVPGSKCSVVYAMASGRKAALAIDNMIWDRELELNVEHELHKAPISEMLYPVRFERLYPQKVKRIKEFEEFEEVEISFTKKQAQLEARRCMKCGYEKVTSDSCIGCGTCAYNCPQNAITMVNPNLKEGK